MNDAAPGPGPRLAALLKAERGRLLAALIARLRDFDLAEESLAEAVESALRHWGRGVPARPEAWLLQVARRKAIDRIRRAARWRDRAPDLALLAAEDEAAAADPPPDIPDERLRLIFTCCHPALDPKSRVALTLRTLGGLTTAEIARAFLDTEATMGQRLSRAKARIAAAGIPFGIPGPDLWPERLNAVLAVIYLVFNEGYAATSGEAQIREGLCGEAIWLARMLDHLAPGDPEILGLLSLMLTTDARRPARTAPDGALVPLDAQDRTFWNRAMIGEGIAALDRAIALDRPGPYQIKAAIGALLVQAPSHELTDWRQIVLLHDALLVHEPTDVVRLNRSVALAQTGALAAALGDLAALAPALGSYQPFHAAQADMLARAGEDAAAARAYDRAIALSGTESERRFLRARKSAIDCAEKKAETNLGPSPTGR
jgi:RNA polymerase sigma-70 factor (ECF subfamily)